MNCISCGKQLMNRLDTFGDVGQEMCQECWILETAAMDSDERGPFEWGYGFFPGGDPRDFRPDYEMCSPREIENWKRDCAAWEAGNGKPCPPSGFWNESHTIHVLAPRYGMGTYKFREES